MERVPVRVAAAAHRTSISRRSSGSMSVTSAGTAAADDVAFRVSARLVFTLGAR